MADRKKYFSASHVGSFIEKSVGQKVDFDTYSLSFVCSFVNIQILTK